MFPPVGAAGGGGAGCFCSDSDAAIFTESTCGVTSITKTLLADIPTAMSFAVPRAVIVPAVANPPCPYQVLGISAPTRGTKPHKPNNTHSTATLTMDACNRLCVPE